ncbi:MAG: hypothetical protein ACP5OC_08085 [Thermoplasmata archaeon]
MSMNTVSMEYTPDYARELRKEKTEMLSDILAGAILAKGKKWP